MKWVLKALVQKGISGMPGRERIHYLLQKHLSRSLPIPDDIFRNKAKIALKHLQVWKKHCKSNLRSQAKFLEFGAGWELVGPLVNAAAGIRNQTVVDISKHVRLELIRDTLNKIRQQKEWVENQIGAPISPDIQKIIVALPSNLAFLNDLGIHYSAPIDMRSTNFAPDSFDLILNTSTLEHIPREDIVRILVECFRILRKGGMMSCVIDLTDHFAHYDQTITHYNFLKYSDALWWLFNSKIHFQNRLRCSDYLEMFLNAGFQVVEYQKIIERQADADLLPNLKLAKRFKSNDIRSDIAVGRLDVVLRKN
ncbi:MAG: class I SAM-dependent methyltransferase [Ignavibacteria bacterium]|nr:class I SAM-dependent methyltransferase [Ignavibacteria bacterium]